MHVIANKTNQLPADRETGAENRFAMALPLSTTLNE